MTVIDRSWTNPEQDFVQVHLAMAKEVGWTKAAIVARLAFRTNPRSSEAVFIDGYLWWRAPLWKDDDDQCLGRELGLSRRQIQQQMAELAESGTIIREQHHLGKGGTYDRTYSYRINYGEEPSTPESRMIPIGTIERPDRDNVDDPDRDDVPLVQEVKNPPTPQGGPGDDDHRMFDQLWDAYPRKDDRQAALMAWYRVVRTGKAMQTQLILAARDYAAWVTRERVDPRHVKILANWLDAGSYENHLTEPPKSPYRKLK